MSVPLALIRAHLNLAEGDFGDIPPELLTHYANVAAMWVAAYTGQPFTADNALMVQAALLLVSHQCESREAVTFASAYQLPFGVHDLLSPLKDRVTGYRPEPEAA